MYIIYHFGKSTEAVEPPNLKYKHQHVNKTDVCPKWLPDHIRQLCNCSNSSVKKTHYLKWNKDSDLWGKKVKEATQS